MTTKVLHVYPCLNCGGTEMVFYNLIKFGDREHFKYEIAVQTHGDNEEPFRKLDVPIHLVPYDGPDRYVKLLAEFLRKGKYDVVHAHMHPELHLVLKAACVAGVRCRVAHSHNARVDIPQFIWPALYPIHHKYERWATQLFGCSSLALKWLFPGQYRRGHVINNGIDLDKFRFNPQTRERMRKSHNISPRTKVFINIGRCTDQKNQKFILRLASERKDKDELYVIIGEGPLYDNLASEKEALGLDKLLLAGKRHDVADWLCAADVFLFPSIYEGLGIVAIEAESSGLNVIASDTIPPEADMQLGNFNTVALSDTDLWHRLMDEERPSESAREEISRQAFTSDYNIRTVTKKVESLYKKSQ